MGSKEKYGVLKAYSRESLGRWHFMRDLGKKWKAKIMQESIPSKGTRFPKAQNSEAMWRVHIKEWDPEAWDLESRERLVEGGKNEEVAER